MPDLVDQSEHVVLLPSVWVFADQAAFLQYMADGLGRPVWSIVKELVDNYVDGARERLRKIEAE